MAHLPLWASRGAKVSAGTEVAARPYSKRIQPKPFKFNAESVLCPILGTSGHHSTPFRFPFPAEYPAPWSH